MLGQLNTETIKVILKEFKGIDIIAEIPYNIGIVNKLKEIIND